MVVCMTAAGWCVSVMAVTNVSASVEGSLAALQQQHGAAGGLDVLAMRQARLELKKVEIATLCEAVLEVRGRQAGQEGKRGGKGREGGRLVVMMCRG